jgi:hypothetical protein
MLSTDESHESERPICTHGHTKEQYCSFGSSGCIDFKSQNELHCNFDPAHLYFMSLMCGGLRWVVAYG